MLRMKPVWFEKLISEIIKSFDSELAAIDGTGFSLNNRSKYYCVVAGERKQLRRNFPREIHKKRVIIEGIFSSMKTLAKARGIFKPQTWKSCLERRGIKPSLSNEKKIRRSYLC